MNSEQTRPAAQVHGIVMPFAAVAVRTAQQLNEFFADFKETLPAGTPVTALIPQGMKMMLVSGHVSKTQFDKGNMPEGGLILDVSDDVWDKATYVSQCGRGRIAVPWVSLRVEA
jgi:hypothetical protein